MRKYMFLIALLFIGVNSFSQIIPSATENYIYTKTCLDASCVKKSEIIEYFDGLGRSKQIVNVKASPLGKDVVTKIEYDNFGRQVKDYLPVPQQGSTNGAIYSNPLSNVTSTPYGTERIYSEQILENSPLDRIYKQIQVGNAWSNKPVTFDYETNTATEVKKFITTTTWLNNTTHSVVTQSGNYKASQLYKNTVTDEDGNVSIEFKNGQGQLLLVRKNDGTKNSDTYYVFNEYDKLAFVIQPEAALKGALTPTDLDELCFQYRYDIKGRLVEKKLPGKGWEYMVYDKQDRLILTQDSNLRNTTNNFKSQGWLFNKYDKFGRIVYRGFFKNSSSRLQMQNALNAMNSLNNEERTSSPSITLQGMPLYYTKSAFPTGSMILFAVNYYDTYPVGSPTTPATILSQDVLSPNAKSSISTKSLFVASYIKNIEDDRWTKTYTYYDTKGRVIGTHRINHLGGYTKIHRLLDFSGVVKEIYTYHKRSDTSSQIIIKENFSYDQQNRLLTHKHSINGHQEEILAQNSYDEIGRLRTKKVGGISPTSPLQTINYEYNIRGWLTKINNPDNLGQHLFGYKINYNNETLFGLANPNNEFSKPVKAKYNGNIAEVAWRYLGDLGVKKYGYVYDNMNRLLAGLYQNPTNPTSKEYSEIITYDSNGNIKTLKRTSDFLGTTAKLIDNLTYQYIGNRLTKITDASRNNDGYQGRGQAISYDVNGNMTDMLDKDIQKIKYNYLNLPSYIMQGRLMFAANMDYKYRSDGIKIGYTKSQLGEGNVVTIETRDYLDGFQYLGIEHEGGDDMEDDGVPIIPITRQQDSSHYTNESISGKIVEPQLEFVPTAEGFYSFRENRYIYQYKDHLGNIRVSYAKKKDGSGLDILDENDYYPFGMNHQERESFFAWNFNRYKNYKYNSKELQETGMYDYGARMYLPDIGRWGSVDPLANNYESNSPYQYALNTPSNAIDSNGKLVIFVNGYWNRILNWIGVSPPSGKERYWDFFDKGFIGYVRNFFGVSRNEKNLFLDASSSYGGDSSGADRYELGKQYAKEHWKEIKAGLAKGESIKFVAHSEGAAFAAGMADYLSIVLSSGDDTNDNTVTKALLLSPDEADEFNINGDYASYEVYYDKDWISPAHNIKGITYEMKLFGENRKYAHGATVNKKALKIVENLLNHVINSSDFTKKETESGVIYIRNR